MEERNREISRSLVNENGASDSEAYLTFPERWLNNDHTWTVILNVPRQRPLMLRLMSLPIHLLARFFAVKSPNISALLRTLRMDTQLAPFLLMTRPARLGIARYGDRIGLCGDARYVSIAL